MPERPGLICFDGIGHTAKAVEHTQQAAGVVARAVGDHGLKLLGQQAQQLGMDKVRASMDGSEASSEASG